MSSNKKPLFVLGLPTNGEHSYLFTQFLLGTQWPTNFSMFFRAVPGYEVGDARNILVQEAINVGARYLMFIDEDVVGPANGIRQLLYRLETHPEWTVCGGLYPIKGYPPEPLLFKEWGMGPSWDWKQGELVKVKGTGAGFHLLRVSDLDRMKKPEYYPIRNPWNGGTMKVRQWFKTGSEYIRDEEGVLALAAHTEDSWFYQMCEEEDLQVWIDTSVSCGHYDKNSGTLFAVPLDNITGVKPDPWNNEPRICNLGAGYDYNPNEVSVDLREDPQITYRCDIRKLPDDWAEQFDIVKSNHVLEHISYTEVEDVFREWVRILKPGGTMKIVVPDLEWAAKGLLEGYEDPYIMGSIYGDQGSHFWNAEPYGGEHNGKFLQHSYENNTHKGGFTKQTLAKLFVKSGLVDGEGCTRGGSIYMEAKKPLTMVDRAGGNLHAPGSSTNTCVLCDTPLTGRQKKYCDEHKKNKNK